MAKQIAVSDAVFARLRRIAEERVETESTVIERVLDLYEDSRQVREKTPRQAPPGSSASQATRTVAHRTNSRFPVVEGVDSGSLAESYIQGLLLVSLHELGGVAETRDVIAEMRRYLISKHALTARDLEINTPENGWERWETSARYARKHLVDARLLRSGGPRGAWALSQFGIEEAELWKARE